MKSHATRREVNALRSRMFKLFDLVPESGCYVQWMGLKLKVGPTVFWPHEDSVALAANYQIRQGEEVLDVCSGSGNMVVLSGLKGAGKVVGLEWNPQAVKVANENIRKYGLNGICKVRQSDMFESVKSGERFDVITANLPFTDEVPKNLTQTSMYDLALCSHEILFINANVYLKPKGRMYLAHSDIGALDYMLELADGAGFSVRKMDEYVTKKPHIVFGAYELRRKKE